MHGSEIGALVRKHIKGSIARVGGSVDQLISYQDDIRIQDINILDGGFGSIKSMSQGKGWREIGAIVSRKIKQEVKHLCYGDRVALDRKTIELDMHFAQKHQSLERKFNASISSNVIEHSPNVIFLLLNFHFITNENGWLFHAIPNYRYTYDRFRVPTSIKHFIEDFENHKTFTDETHINDYIQSAIERDGWQRDFHDKYPIKYPYMHFHVFDEVNTKELFQLMFEEVTVDVLRNNRFSDNVVICRNKLNKNFYEKYAELIEEVKNDKYLKKSIKENT